MKYTPVGYTDPFLSPVSGQLASYLQLPDLDRGSLWVGNGQGRAAPSLKLIDLRVDVDFLIDEVNTLNQEVDTLNEEMEQVMDGPLIVQTPAAIFPNAQALSTLAQTVTAPLGAMVKVYNSVLYAATPEVDYLTEVPSTNINSGSAPGRGLSISGSPFEPGGTVTLTLDSSLQNLASLSSLGLVVFTGSSSCSTIALQAGTGITVSNGSGVAGNPVITLSNVGTAGTYAYPSSLTTNAQGQVSSITAGTAPVTSVGVTTTSAGLSVSGSPVTSSGIISLTLGSELQGLSSLSANGIVTRINNGTYTTRTLSAGNGIGIAYPDGVANNPQIYLSGGYPSGSYSWPVAISINNTGQVTSVITGTIVQYVTGTTNQINVTASSTPVVSIANNPIIPGTASITLPVGTVAQRPSSPLFGMIRANSDSSVWEAYIGSGWKTLNTSGGTVSSVGISGSTGLSVSGSPITSSGTISLTLGSELQALSGLSVTGIIVRTGSASYTPRTLTAGTGINIANPDGVAGNPTISLGTVPIANLSGYPGTSTQLLRGNGTWATPSLSDFNPPASGSTINFNNATITNFGNSSNTLTLNGSTVYANGAFAVSGSYATSLGGTLAVTGATTLSNNLTVSGNYSTYLGGTLSVVGITYLNGGLIANTGCIFTGGVTLNNTLTVSGNYATSLGGTLAVTGTTTLSSTLTASAGVVVGNTLFPPTGGIYVTSVIGTSVIGFAYYKLSGTSAVTGYWSSSGLPLSIQCTNAIAAVEFEATSSIKKKNILENRDSFQDELVNKFDSLDFVKYEWKDKHKEGAGDYFGYIAENVAEQFPSLVNLDHLEYAPSIMKMATLKVIDSATCEISFEEDVDIPLDAKIKFLRPDDQKEWEGVVVTEDNPHTYVLSVEREGLSDGEIFVYGTYEKVPLVSKTRFHDMVAARMRILIDEVNLLSQKVSRLEAQRT